MSDATMRMVAGSPAAETSQAHFASDVQYYLAQQPRQLPSRYLYDALGSALFEAICRLPWVPRDTGSTAAARSARPRDMGTTIWGRPPMVGQIVRAVVLDTDTDVPDDLASRIALRSSSTSRGLTIDSTRVAFNCE